MMSEQFIEHNGTKYEVKEPTIKMWADVMRFKDILEENELYIKMIEVVTGMKKEDILKTDVNTIKRIGNYLYKFINQESKKVFHNVEHKGIKYKLVDINRMSFGQFVDIDTFFSKDESYRIANLHELAAYLYCEEDIEYGKSDFSARIETMKDLPIKYVEGALFFFLSLGNALQALSALSSQNPLKYQMMRLKLALAGFGGGMHRLLFLPKTKFGKLTMLLLSPLYLVLIIFLTSWMLIKKKKN